MIQQAQFVSSDEGRCAIRGRMTFETVPALLKEMVPAVATGTGPIIVDMTDVDHADSAGMTLLLELLRIARRYQREIEFVNLPAQLSRLVRVSQLQHVFKNLES